MRRGASPRRVRGLYTPVPFTVAKTSPKPPGRVAALMQSVENEVLGVTFWFDPGQHRKGDSLTIRFSGQRVGVDGPLQKGDRFEQDEKVEEVVAGSGPISLTARVYGINAGQWMVTAEMLSRDVNGQNRSKRARPPTITEPVHRAAWSWRKWRLTDAPAVPVKTTLLPFIHVPGVIPGFWTLMGVLGFILALAVQALVLSNIHAGIEHALPFSLFAIALGLIGAKVWFVVLRWRERRLEGWCIQGLLAGVAVAAVVGVVAIRLPIGTFLDASTPGLFFGMAVGRVGCFFGGCCAGRPTASRWGLWSVLDQRVGMRRIPTQWMETTLDLGVGSAALVAVLRHGPFGGALFVAAIAAYTLVRQGILRLRGGPPKSAAVTRLTAAAAALVLIADLLLVMLSPGVVIP